MTRFIVDVVVTWAAITAAKHFGLSVEWAVVLGAFSGWVADNINGRYK